MTTIATQRSHAMASPCFEAEECRNLDFYRRGPTPFDHITVGLTVNIGLE